MSRSQPVTFARLAAMLGVLLVLASPALALGQWYSIRGPLKTLAWFDDHRAPGDSVAYASALYHAGHARASIAGQWQPTGYATLGAAGTLIGVALLGVSARRRGQRTALE
jgi:hypothetical protein